MDIPQQMVVAPTPDQRPRRARRWTRRLGKCLVILLTVAGAWSIYRTFAGEPEVGFFRSEEGSHRVRQALQRCDGQTRHRRPRT